MSRALRPLAENMEIKVARLEDGAGIWVLAALWLAVLASLRPNGTAHDGPPSSTVPSRAARARISAQEITLGQAAST